MPTPIQARGGATVKMASPPRLAGKIDQQQVELDRLERVELPPALSQREYVQQARQHLEKNLRDDVLCANKGALFHATGDLSRTGFDVSRVKPDSWLQVGDIGCTVLWVDDEPASQLLEGWTVLGSKDTAPIDNAIREVVGEGGRISHDQFREIFTKINANPRFIGVDMEVVPGPQGVDLSIYVVQRPTSLRGDGVGAFTSQELSSYFRPPRTRQRLLSGLENLRQAYGAKGIIPANLRLDLRGGVLLISVQERPMPTAVEVEGTTQLPAATLRGLVAVFSPERARIVQFLATQADPGRLAEASYHALSPKELSKLLGDLKPKSKPRERPGDRDARMVEALAGLGSLPLAESLAPLLTEPQDVAALAGRHMLSPEELDLLFTRRADPLDQHAIDTGVTRVLKYYRERKLPTPRVIYRLDGQTVHFSVSESVQTDH